jgi:hypothetical protein
MVFLPERPRFSRADPDDAAQVELVFQREARAPLAPGPVRLRPAYVRLLLEVEAAPANQDGADKTWVETALASYRRHYELARDEIA